MPERPAQRAPAGLGRAGRRLWRRITEGLLLRADERELLELACRTADNLATLEAALEEAEPVVRGSRSQPRPHPLFAEVRATREALRRLLGDLDVPEGEGLRTEWDGLSSSSRARKAARARWG